MKIVNSLALLIVVALAGLYATSPLLLNRFVPMYLQTLGVHQSRFDFSRPGIHGIKVQQAWLQVGEVTVTTSGVTLAYSLSSLATGRVEEVFVRQLDIVKTTSPENSSTGNPLPALTSPWELIPAQRLHIESFTVVSASPTISINGQLNFDLQGITSQMTLQNPDLPTVLQALVEVNPDGSAQLSLSSPEDAPAIVIRAHQESPGSLRLTGELDLRDGLFRLLTGLQGATHASGSARGTLNGTVPWPLDPDTMLADIQGVTRVDLTFTGDLAAVTGIKAEAQLSASLDQQQIHLASTGFSVSADQLIYEGQAYQSRLGGRAQGTFMTTFPLNADQTSGELSAAVANIAVDLSLPAITVLSPETTLEAGEIHGNLVLELSNHKLRLSSESLSVSATRLSHRNNSYDLSIGTLSLTPDISLPWPLPDDPDQMITGQLGMVADLVATDGQQGSIDLTGKFKSTFNNSEAGQWRMEVLAGTVINLAFGSRLGIEADETFVVRLAPGSGTISADDINVSLRLPVLNLTSDQQLTFRKSVLLVETLSLTGNKLVSNGEFRSGTSTQAIPLHYSTIADMEALTGEFSLRVDHNVSRALIRNDLPGWKGNYDLDSGHLDFRLTGSFRFGDELFIDGDGDLAITDGDARYEEISATQLNARLPISVKDSFAMIKGGDIRVGTVDAALPVTDVKFNISTDFSLADINRLTANVLGAGISIDQLKYDIDHESSDFQTRVTGLPVGNVLALEGEDIQGDGILDGLLPVRITARGVAIDKGTLTSRPPGGHLKYLGDLPATNPALDLAVRALRDFHYHTMNLDVNYEPTGELALLVKLQGKSPDVEQGRPIHFNLNVTENIPDLLESLRASGELSERVQQRLSR